MGQHGYDKPTVVATWVLPTPWKLNMTFQQGGKPAEAAEGFSRPDRDWQTVLAG